MKSLKAYTGNFLTEEEYWELALRGLELGLEEAVRIYVVNQLDFLSRTHQDSSRGSYMGWETV